MKTRIILIQLGDISPECCVVSHINRTKKTMALLLWMFSVSVIFKKFKSHFIFLFQQISAGTVMFVRQLKARKFYEYVY